MPELYPHQITGADWLAERSRACLFDEQGLGKTITAIVAADQVQARRVLVLTPAVVLWNWAREWGIWSPSRRVCVIHNSMMRPDPTASVFITTHGLLIRESVRAHLLRWHWDVCIVDEAHLFRTRTTQRAQVLFGQYDNVNFPTVIGRCQRVWLMTGTPMPNNASELWTMLWACFPDRILAPNGTIMRWETFRRQFCLLARSRYGEAGLKVVGNRNLPDLKRRINGVALRRLKKDCLDLPPIRFEMITLRPEVLPTELLEIERELQPDLVETIRQSTDPEAAFTLLGNHVQLARYRRLCGIAKVAPAAELLTSELTDGGMDKVVVFAHHRDVIDPLCEALDQFGVVRIVGATPLKARQRAVDLLQGHSGIRVAVCHIVAGGTGVTLTAAQDVVFVEMSYSPGENAQAAERVYRIGQLKRVRVRFIALAGTIDEPLVTIVRRKTRMIREVLS